MPLTNLGKWCGVLLGLLILVVIGTAIFNTSTDLVIDLLRDREFGQVILFSLQTSIVSTLLAAVTAVPVGLYLARNKTLATKFIDALFDIPIVMPPLIVGVLLLSFFNLPFIKNVYGFIFTVPGAIIAQFFVAMPFTIRASKSSFELVSPIYEQIAMTLGATPSRAFFDTTCRIALPGIIAGLILSWLRCLSEFGATMMVGGAIPGRTANVPIYIYLNMSSGDFDKGMAASVIAIFCVFAGLLLVKVFVDWK